MVTYAYYRDAYRGANVPEAEFERWAMRAEERLSADTCGRSDGVLLAALVAEQVSAASTMRETAQKNTQALQSAPVQEADVLAQETDGETVSPLGEQTRRAVCAVAELLYRAEQGERARGALVHETVGGWSRSYAVCNTREATRQIQAAEALYLGGTGLLYRGR